MTDNEIIKFMQCVVGNDANCSECEYQKVLPFPSCRMMCAKNALDLINSQKAEIERLKKNIDGLNIFTTNHMKVIRVQAIKEFAERLKSRLANLSVQTKTHGRKTTPNYVDDIANQILHDVVPQEIDNLVKEMTEVQE